MPVMPRNGARGSGAPVGGTIFIFKSQQIAIHMFMSMMSNCSGERSFSKIALIKNKLRSTMSDRWLSALEVGTAERCMRMMFWVVFHLKT